MLEYLDGLSDVSGKPCVDGCDELSCLPVDLVVLDVGVLHNGWLKISSAAVCSVFFQSHWEIPSRPISLMQQQHLPEFDSLLKMIRAYWFEMSSCNHQFFSELITTQLIISQGVTANSLYLSSSPCKATSFMSLKTLSHELQITIPCVLVACCLLAYWWQHQRDGQASRLIYPWLPQCRYWHTATGALSVSECIPANFGDDRRRPWKRMFHGKKNVRGETTNLLDIKHQNHQSLVFTRDNPQGQPQESGILRQTIRSYWWKWWAIKPLVLLRTNSYYEIVLQFRLGTHQNTSLIH